MRDDVPDGTRSTSRAARALAFALLAAAACAHGPGTREALPAHLHARVSEVLVYAAEDGVPVRISSALLEVGLDGGLQGALRDAVVAEAHRAGAPAVRAAEERELRPPPAEPASPPPPPALVADGLRANLVVADPPPPPPAPRPPAGAAWLGVRVVNVALTSGAQEDPLALQLEAVGTIDACGGTAASWRLRDRGEAAYAVVVADADPRPAAEWTADGGKAARDAVSRLVAGAARRIAGALLATAADGSTGTTCGPSLRSDPDGERAEGERLVLRWSRWAPDGPDGRALPVRYDLRLWRIQGDGSAQALAAREGLAQESASVAGLAAGATYAWTVRGVAELPGGRRIASAWSHARPEVGGCAVDPDPVHARRFRTVGEGDAPAAAAQAARPQRIAVVYGAEPQPGGARIEGAVVAKAMAGAAAGGAGGGLQASFACGPFFPICAAVLVPAGALFGTALGAVGGVIAGYRSGPDEPEPAREPVRSALEAALRRAVDDPAFERGLVLAANPAPGAGGAPIELARAEVRLVPVAAESRPASLRLTVTGRRTGADGAPDERTVRVDGVGPVLAHVWLDDGAALLAASVPPLAARAGARLAEAFLAPPPPAPEKAPPPEPEIPVAPPF